MHHCTYIQDLMHILCKGRNMVLRIKWRIKHLYTSVAVELHHSLHCSGRSPQEDRDQRPSSNTGPTLYLLWSFSHASYTDPGHQSFISHHLKSNTDYRLLILIIHVYVRKGANNLFSNLDATNSWILTPYTKLMLMYEPRRLQNLQQSDAESKACWRFTTTSASGCIASVL